MNIKTLIGAGDQIMAVTLPAALVGIIFNILYPEFFSLNIGQVGTILGWILLVPGVPIWLIAVVQVLVYVPQNRLITTGPFAIVLHPIYTSVALLVLPGIGFLFDTWAGIGIGLILYISSRLFSVKEDKKLEETFADEYRSYRSKILLPWL